MDLKIGPQLKCIRRKRGMTLDDLAAATGVSKPMLSSIEREVSTPTITILWKIASGLKIPLSYLLETLPADYQLNTIRDADPILECEGKMRAWPVQEYDPIRSMESFLIEMDPGCIHVSRAHNPGVEEMVLVQQGEMKMILDNQTIPVKEGQVLKFRADADHTYTNTSSDICIFYNQIYYGGQV